MNLFNFLFEQMLHEAVVLKAKTFCYILTVAQ